MYRRGLGLACSPGVLRLRQVTVEHLALTPYRLVQALSCPFSLLRLFKLTTFTLAPAQVQVSAIHLS